MARVSYDDSEKYFSGGSSEWFQLKNDGDVARVQFMLNSMEDIPIFSTHKVKVDGKDRYVDCLRSPEDPIECCPFCAAGLAAKAVRFIIMFQHDDEKVKIWERGRQFMAKLQGLINRYSPLENYVFDIERHGKAGDQTTKYEIYPIDSVQPFNLNDVEMPDLEGGLILQKSVEEMEYYLNYGQFPDSEVEQPVNVRRRQSAGSTPVSRRTPATNDVAGSRRATRASSPRAQMPVTPPADTASTSATSRASRSRRTEVF